MTLLVKVFIGEEIWGRDDRWCCCATIYDQAKQEVLFWDYFQVKNVYMKLIVD